MTEASNGTTEKPTKSLALVKPSMGDLASKIDPAELDAAVGDRRAALELLLEDPTLSDATRKSLDALIKLSSPNKPGLEEVVLPWRVSRVNICQPTTRSEMKPESARPGDLYTTSGQLLEKPWGVIVLYMFEENINFPDGGKNPVCSAPDGKLGSPYGKCLDCPHLPMGKQKGAFEDQKKTDCQSNIVAVVLAKDLSQVYQVQFGKTSRKAGSVLLSLAGQQSVLWKQSYVLSTEKKTNDAGLYYIMKTEPTSKDNSEDVCRVAEALYALYGAERKRFLADWYLRPTKAPQAAVEAEGEFAAGALEAGLAGGGGEEPTDLNDAPAKPHATASRNSSKPM